MPEQNKAITLTDVTIGYGSKIIASHISASLNYGQVCALIGCNGSGKSTLLRSITAQIPTVSGNIYMAGKNIHKIGRKEMAQVASIVTTEQISGQDLTVADVVGMGRYLHTGLIRHFSSNDTRIVNQAMKQAGIFHKKNALMAHISDGERQKTMIARALAQESKIIILDEPFSFLDPAARIEILNLLITLARTENKAVLLSTHDVAQALRMLQQIWLLLPNQQFMQGTPKELIDKGIIDNVFENKSVKFDKNQNDFVIL